MLITHPRVAVYNKSITMNMIFVPNQHFCRVDVFCDVHKRTPKWWTPSMYALTVTFIANIATNDNAQ